MLRKFKVTNFKGFNETFVFDLTDINNYSFNSKCIKNNIVNNSIIYGRNGVGKSNLALAIFDIIEHLTDKNKNSSLYTYYLNAVNNSNFAEFYFEFLINNKTVIYEYKKTDHKTIIYEKFSINKEVLASIDRRENNNATFKLKGTETLKKEIENRELSILKYVKNNSELEKNKINSTFLEFFNYIDKMLYFRHIQNKYIGMHIGEKIVDEIIIEKNNVSDFEQFLNEAGVECTLTTIEEFGKKRIAFDFGTESSSEVNKIIPFYKIASQGTIALSLFYYWFQFIKINNEVSFVFIDEFDAFYHHELTALIVKELMKTGVQFILTTHNTTIISNDLMRPDCYFLMNKKTIKPLSNCTEKELREAHNLEKMYKSGMFNVN